MIIESHCHIGPSTWSFAPGEFTAGQLLERMKEAGVTHACCFSFWDCIDNDYTYRATRGHPELIPFALINPSLRGAAQELERCLTQLGMRGLKLNSETHGHPVNFPKIMDPVMDLCQAHGVPVVAHAFADTAFTMPWNFRHLADRFPKVNIIMLHAGYRWGFYDAVEASRTRPNLFIGTTLVPPRLLQDGIKRIGADKFVFEADAPYWDFVVQIAKVEAALKKSSERDLVLGGNMKRLLGL